MFVSETAYPSANSSSEIELSPGEVGFNPDGLVSPGA